MNKDMSTETVVITAQEAALYDRQIRLWGLESQKRLRCAKVLMCGMNGLGAEISKNVILAGIQQITFLDHRTVTEGETCSQFLIPASQYGDNRAEASFRRAQALNTMVDIIIDTDRISDKKQSFFLHFDVVIVTDETTEETLKLNTLCHTNNIKFFTGDVWGMFGYGFTDLQAHTFAEDIAKHKIIKTTDNEKPKTELVYSTVKRTINFPSFESVMKFDYKSPSFLKKIKRNGPAYLILKVLQKFRDDKERDPCFTSRVADTQELLRIRDEIAPGLIMDSAFLHVFAQVSPAVAIVGGEIAQEIIKAVSQKEAPHFNVFLFDPENCCGFIEAIEVI